MHISKYIVNLCLAFSRPLGKMHHVMNMLGLAEIPQTINDAPGGLGLNLKKIWKARLLKKLLSIWVRSPFRGSAFTLVNFNLDIPFNYGMVIVTCHTPWKRLLVKWFSENYYALIIDTGNTLKRDAKIKNRRKGYSQFQHVIRHLQYGGKVIIAADTFNKLVDLPIELLGKSGNLSLLPARLARIAGVPMLIALPQLTENTIQINTASFYEPPKHKDEIGPVMRDIIGFIEHSIREDPSIWSYFVNDSLSDYHKKRIE